MFRLVINYIVIYDFCGSAANVIHPSNPLHLVIRLEFFGYALTLRHLFYEPKKHIQMVPKRCHEDFSILKKPVFMRVFSVFGIIPTQ